ncbi:FixH family protein [Oceanobacillus sp. CF4.6]|uniref:FixH family protein n=1 Tax=Oceanobacillus sp. CF4.6 TaxID=3373080 RepID=UPI003EE43506
MTRKSLLFMFILLICVLAACNGTAETETEDEELKSLDVEFDVPEQAAAGETIELNAIVTYGDEEVIDADEVKFEYWEKGNEEDSIKVDATNNGDGTYSTEVSFDHDGVYEMYAHTSARAIHTMPKKSITIGEGASADQGEENHEDDGHHEHSGNNDGFEMDFMEPEGITVNQEIDLTVHLQMDNEAFENADVRYEIVNDSNSEKHDWVDTEESVPGEYTSPYSFVENGSYTVIIHVEDDEGLHEHQEYKIEVGK